jgi:DNA adenine methylase
MRPPTQYFGSKGRLAPWIASLLPPARTYVEPFCGSAAVLFAKAPSPTEILNDQDGDLVLLFRVLRDRGPELARALRHTPYARAELAAANLDTPGLGELERARRVFVRLNMSISRTLGRQRGFAAAFNTNGADHAHKFASLVDQLEAAATRLRRVILEDRPALEVIAKYGAANAVIYCDPPYLDSTRSAQAKRRGADYACEYATQAEHRELAAALHATPAAVLVSGYPSALYEQLYAGWWRLERMVDKPSSLTSGGRATHATEVVWSNRPLAVQLDLLDHHRTGTVPIDIPQQEATS